MILIAHTSSTQDHLLDQDSCRLCKPDSSLAAHADGLRRPGGEGVRCLHRDICLAMPIHWPQLEQPSLGEVRSHNVLLCHRFAASIAIRSIGAAWGFHGAAWKVTAILAIFLAIPAWQATHHKRRWSTSWNCPCGARHSEVAGSCSCSA